MEQLIIERLLINPFCGAGFPAHERAAAASFTINLQLHRDA